MKGHITKLDKETQKKHFRHELGLGDPYARGGVYTDKYKLKMRMATGTKKERLQARKMLEEMGEIVNESLSEYLERIKKEKDCG